MIWLILGVGLLALLAYLIHNGIKIWRSLKSLGSASRAFGAALSEFSDERHRELADISNVYEDPSRLVAAREDRDRLRSDREIARRRRLNSAIERWDSAADSDFERFDADHREAARRTRERLKDETLRRDQS